MSTVKEFATSVLSAALALAYAAFVACVFALPFAFFVFAIRFAWRAAS